MDYSNERYVRVYTRDTLTWRRLGWEGQAVLVLVLRKLDRTGVLETADFSPADAVSAITGVPLEVCERAVPMLLQLGVLEHVGSSLVAPKFIEAQEASMTPAARQKEHRLRRRDQIRGGLDPSQRETAIYFVQSEHGGEIKIGRADDVAKRLAGLSTGRPDKLVLLAAAPGTLAQERKLHERFAAHRVKGEWFAPCDDLMALVADVSERSSGAFDVLSQNVTCNESLPVTRSENAPEAFAVTPSRAVPSVLNRAVPSKSAGDGDPLRGNALVEWILTDHHKRYYAAHTRPPAGTKRRRMAEDLAKWVEAASGAYRLSNQELASKILQGLFASEAASQANHNLSWAVQCPEEFCGMPDGSPMPARKTNAQAADSAREAETSSKLRSVRAEYATRIQAARAEGDIYGADRLIAERDQRLAYIEAKAS